MAKRSGLRALSDSKIEGLIEEVKCQPSLFDKACKEYRDREKNDGIWQKIAHKLDLSVDEASSGWASLRDTRTRYKRKDSELKRSGSACKKMRSWKWKAQMSFLDDKDYTQEETATNIPEPESHVGDAEDGSQDDSILAATLDSSESDQSDGESLTSSAPKRVQPGKRKAKETTGAAIVQYLHAKEKRKKEKANKDEDSDQKEDRLFLLSCLSTFKQLSRLKRMTLRKEIQDVCFKYEMEHQSQDRNVTSISHDSQATHETQNQSQDSRKKPSIIQATQGPSPLPGATNFHGSVPNVVGDQGAVNNNQFHGSTSLFSGLTYMNL